MKFVVDAQLPERVARWLQASGHEAIHTKDLPDGNRTPDSTINELSLREHYVVVTKDEDFVDTFLLRHEPYKLLLIATGNITNDGCSSTIWKVLSRLLTNAILSNSSEQL